MNIAALRLYPPVPVNLREAVQDTVLPVGGGPDGRSPIFISKGTAVYYSAFALHRRKDVYGPDANEFRPERWTTLRPGWCYVPFNGGPRICIGRKFLNVNYLTRIYVLIWSFNSRATRSDTRMLCHRQTVADICKHSHSGSKPMERASASNAVYWQWSKCCYDSLINMEICRRVYCLLVYRVLLISIINLPLSIFPLTSGSLVYVIYVSQLYLCLETVIWNWHLFFFCR